MGSFEGIFCVSLKMLKRVNRLQRKPGSRFLFLSFFHGVLKISSLTAAGGRPLSLADLKSHSRKTIGALYNKLESVSSILSLYQASYP